MVRRETAQLQRPHESAEVQLSCPLSLPPPPRSFHALYHRIRTCAVAEVQESQAGALLLQAKQQRDRNGEIYMRICIPSVRSDERTFRRLDHRRPKQQDMTCILAAHKLAMKAKPACLSSSTLVLGDPTLSAHSECPVEAGGTICLSIWLKIA